MVYDWLEARVTQEGWRDPEDDLSDEATERDS